MANQSHNVAAIDFGTACCSLSYTINEGDVDINDIDMLVIDDNNTRVPTALLLKKNEDGSISRIDIGFVAQQKHANLTKNKFKEHIYFECFKMELRDEQRVSRDMKITAFADKDFYLLEVIALVLEQLRTKLEKHMTKRGSHLKAKDFLWVVTVPAIWKHRGKQMMREAAYRAGLLSDKVDPITFLTPTCQSLKAINMTDCADRLTLALEPECAALFCQLASSDMIATHSLQGYASYTSKCYMVLDIGGGTVDIAIHELTEDGKIKSVLPPKGNDYGGTKVNCKFSELLQKIVNDKGFNRFYKECDDLTEATHRAVIAELLFQDFEKDKVHFGDSPDSDQEVSIRLNHRFVKFYGEDVIEHGVQSCQDEGIKFDDDALIIHFSYLRELFDEATKEITVCMKEALEESPITIDRVYLVGGFGGSQYIHEKVKANLHHSIKVIVPKDHKLAVCQGAVLFQQSPSVIKSRISDAYYGLLIHERYDPTIHPSSHKVYNDSFERYDCRDIFRIFIDKGQTVHHSDYFEKSFLPGSKTTNKVALSVYRTIKNDVKYVKDDNCQPIVGVKCIGSVSLKTPSCDLPYEQRNLKVKFHLGGTELKVSGLYIPTNEKVHAAFDPLSC